MRKMFEIGEWYWIKDDNFNGKPFGKIIQNIKSRLYLVRLCTVKKDGSSTILDKNSLCNRESIGEKLASDEFRRYAMVLEI